MGTGNMRNKIVFLIAILTSLIHLYYPVFGILKTSRVIHLLLFSVIVFLVYPLKTENRILKKVGFSIDILLILGAITFGVYPLLDFDAFILRAESLITMDIWMGILAIVVVLEGVRRSTGLPMLILSLLFLTYAFTGPHMPDLIAHKGAFLEDVINIVYIAPEGLYGLPTAVMTSYVFLFIIFGSLLEASGGSHHIMNLVGRMTGGPAKIACISSGMMASISGSAVANVATTGAVTIPMMKKMGFPPHVAGAIEAIASTGGMITPPVMGAAAFIMCELVSTTYLKVIIMAAIPAILYYYTLFIVIHLESRKRGLKTHEQDEEFSVYRSVKEGWWVAIPLVTLVGLLVSQYSAPRSIVFSILTLVVIIYVKNGLWEGTKKILNAFNASTHSTCSLSILCAAAGVVISMVNLTGLGIKFSTIILTLSHGVSFIALLIAAFVCVFLGMGLPVTAAYLTTVAIAGPALVNLGFPLPASHLFVIFFAVLSNITPPFCMSAYTASGIAKSDVWKTGWLAFKYGFTGYIIPFLFIFTPALLILNADFANIAKTLIVTAVSLSALAIGIVGFFRVSLSIPWRLLFVSSGILLVLKSIPMKGIGLGLYVVMLFLFLTRYKTSPVLRTMPPTP
jgi:TRAP transporter 4TM/12TM fusion protein